MDNDKRIVMSFEDLTGDYAVFRLHVNLFGVKAQIGGFYLDDLRDLLESCAEALNRADAWTTEEDAVNRKMQEDDEKRRYRAEKAEAERLRALDILEGYEKKWTTPDADERQDGPR